MAKASRLAGTAVPKAEGRVASALTVAERFASVDTSEYPDVHALTKCLDWALWVLLLAKDELHTPRLSARQIVDVLVQSTETSTSTSAVIMALNRAGNRVHVHKRSRASDTTTYEIMDAGRKYLLGLTASAVVVLYFAAGQKYTSKRVLGTSR